MVSYYAKGALVALAIDLAVRARTNGQASLDDAMRLLWQRHGTGFYSSQGGPGPAQSGLAEDGFAAVLREATGVSLGSALNRWVEGTDDLPLAKLLAPLGVTLKLAAPDLSPSLGVRLATRSGDLAIASAYSGGAAQRAGLSAGDLLVACDGLRVDEKALKGLLLRRKPGETVVLHAFRRDELMRFEVKLDAPAASEAALVATDGPNTLREDWLSVVSRKARARPRPARARA